MIQQNPTQLELVNIVCASNSTDFRFHLPIVGFARIFDDGTLGFQGKNVKILKDTTGLNGSARTLDVQNDDKVWRLYTDQPTGSKEQLMEQLAILVGRSWVGTVKERIRTQWFGSCAGDTF